MKESNDGNKAPKKSFLYYFFLFLKNNTFKSVSFETFLSRRMCKNS